MILVAVGTLLGLAAVSLGLRTTALLMPVVPPNVRLIASSVIGTILVAAALPDCAGRRGARPASVSQDPASA